MLINTLSYIVVYVENNTPTPYVIQRSTSTCALVPELTLRKYAFTFPHITFLFLKLFCSRSQYSVPCHLISILASFTIMNVIDAPNFSCCRLTTFTRCTWVVFYVLHHTSGHNLNVTVYTCVYAAEVAVVGKKTQILSHVH